MIVRPEWQRRIEERWRRRSILWLKGVRRAGKTFLSRSLPDVEYFDCELPRTRRQIEEVEAFLADTRGKRLVLDEIHRLPDPAEILKVAADHFPETRILATGSSSLGASARFRDTLAGRKEELWLTPMVAADLTAFGKPDLERRLRRGGLPPFFLAEEEPERDYYEWIEAFWAKDVLELFRLEKRAAFLRFFDLLLASSGGIFEATKYARPCEVSRTTITNYLSVLEAALVIHVLRPFSTNPATEIVSAPRVYGFDTGFVCFARGWSSLRPEDFGVLWEHYVLNELSAHLQTSRLRYWRTKQHHEIDFVLPRRGSPPIAIECKWRAEHVDRGPIAAFLRRYPGSQVIVVANDVDRPYRLDIENQPVRVTSLAGLLEVVPSS